MRVVQSYSKVRNPVGCRHARSVSAAGAAIACLLASAATAQLPCRYEVAAVIAPPPCPFFDNAIGGLGISPNGRFVCGVHGQCDDYSEGWVYDTLTAEFRTIPRPPGVLGATATDVNDFGLTVG